MLAGDGSVVTPSFRLSSSTNFGQGASAAEIASATASPSGHGP
jgi:hypothetical protein